MKNDKIILYSIIGVLAIALVIAIIVITNQPKTEAPSTPLSNESAATAGAGAKVVTPPTILEIEIKNFAYNPSTIRIKTGTKITWYNADNSPHTVTSDSGGKAEVNSEILSPGDSYGHLFDMPGTFNYHCNFHTNMKGTVIVE